MGFMSQDALERIGFACIGKNVSISDRASFHTPSKIEIGDNSRIDDFCVLSAGEGGIKIGAYVHLGVMSALIGAGKITIGDYSTLSGRVNIYSSNDDYTGRSMVNPTIPEKFRNATNAEVAIGRHVIIGAGSVILPGVEILDGVSVGALSLVKTNLPKDTIWAGVPVEFVRQRSQEIYNIEIEFWKEMHQSI